MRRMRLLLAGLATGFIVLPSVLSFLNLPSIGDVFNDLFGENLWMKIFLFIIATILLTVMISKTAKHEG